MVPRFSSRSRKGCKDIWNAFMARGAKYTINDIPVCPTTATSLPKQIITWEEAKAIYKREIVKNKDFLFDAFVCFYIDDYKFDGARGIWSNPRNALKKLRHFSGVISPDFSTYQDFPRPIKIYNTYRMRAFGYWLGKNGLAVINNVRWGSEETWDYCFDGIPENSIVAIGTVGGSPRKHIDRDRFERGLDELIRVLRPCIIIVYGSANYECFKRLDEKGITVLSFPSHTALAFKRRQTR